MEAGRCSGDDGRIREWRSAFSTGLYTIEFPSALPDLGTVLDVTTTAPGVTIRPLPEGPHGSTRFEVQVAETAPHGQAEVRVISEHRQADVPLIVVPPPGSPPSEAVHAHAELADDKDGERESEGQESRPTGFSRTTGFLVVFALGLLVGVVVGRRRPAR